MVRLVDMFKGQERVQGSRKRCQFGVRPLEAICIGVRSEARRKCKMRREPVRVKEDRGKAGSFELYLEKRSRKTQKRKDI